MGKIVRGENEIEEGRGQRPCEKGAQARLSWMRSGDVVHRSGMKAWGWGNADSTV